MNEFDEMEFDALLVKATDALQTIRQLKEENRRLRRDVAIYKCFSGESLIKLIDKDLTVNVPVNVIKFPLVGEASFERSDETHGFRIRTKINPTSTRGWVGDFTISHVPLPLSLYESCVKNLLIRLGQDMFTQGVLVEKPRGSEIS